MASLTWEDLLALVLYVVAVLAIGFYASCRAKTDNAKGYFLANMSSNWFLIGTSTFATNIGSPTFTGLPGSAAAGGIAVVMFEWHAMVMLIALGWLFLPVYRASGCYTMPQYLKLRFGGERIRLLLAIISMFGVIIVQIAGQMYSGALFIQQFFQWDLYLSVALILGVTALYTIIGGLTAVMWTDAMQSFVLIAGSLILSIIGLRKVGGWEGIKHQYPLAAANYTWLDYSLYGNHTCGLPRDDWNHIFRSVDADYPWPGMIVGVTLIGTNAWCTDQVCVQRSLSAKSISHAKAGLLLAGYLKILPFLFYIIPGMISRILYPEEIACADPAKCLEICGNPSGCTNIAYPLLVMRILPAGVRGVMLAALLAALMSSLTSIFNSSSTLFTMDIYTRIRKNAKSRELMVVGRLCVLVLVGISILWLPILNKVQGSQIWNYFMEFASYMTPPIVAAFYFGLFWKRTTEPGAFFGILTGILMGLIRCILSWTSQAPPCGDLRPDTRPAVLSKVHFLHFSCISLVVCSAVIVAVSFCTKPRSEGQLRRVTVWTKNDPRLQEGIETGEEEVKENSSEETLMESQRKPFQPEDPPRPVTFQRRLLRFVCGVDDSPRQRLTREETLELQRKATDITENPFWSKVLNVNALIVLGVAVFLHAFFA